MSELENLRALRNAAQEWRDGLENDGWTEEEVRHSARPGLVRILDALDALSKGDEVGSDRGGEDVDR